MEISSNLLLKILCFICKSRILFPYMHAFFLLISTFVVIESLYCTLHNSNYVFIKTLSKSALIFIAKRTWFNKY